MIRSSSLALKEEPELKTKDLDNANDLVANQNNLAVGFAQTFSSENLKNMQNFLPFKLYFE